MCTVFWDAESILLVDSMPHELTITGVYYADVLRKLHVTINPSIHHVYFRQLLGPHQRYVHRYIRSAEERWPRYPYFCMTMHAHRSHVWQAVVLECGFEEMHNPTYSPELAPSDYHLFPNLQNTFVDREFWPMISSSQNIFYRHWRTPRSLQTEYRQRR